MIGDRAAAFAALLAPFVVGCAGGDEVSRRADENGDSREESVVSTTPVRVFAWDDGSASVLAWQSDTAEPYVRHFSSDGALAWSMYGAQSNVGAPSYIATDTDAAHHGGAVYAAFTQNVGVKWGDGWKNGVYSVVRVSRLAKGQNDPVSSAWSAWRGGSGYQPEAFIGPTKIAADADGTLYVLYGTKGDVWSTGDDASTPAANRRGLQLVTCTTFDACSRTQIVDVEKAHRDRYAVAAGPEGPVVAVAGDTETDVVHIRESVDGAWEHTAIDLPGMGKVVPRLAAGAGRTILAVSSQLGSLQAAPAARYTLLFERLDDGWEQIAKLESLSVKSLDVRVGSAGISLFARLRVSNDWSGTGEPMGRVLYEADGWAPRELTTASTTWASSEGASSLGADGSLRYYDGSVSSWSTHLAKVTPGLHRWAEDEGRGAGSISAKDPCLVAGLAVALEGSQPRTVKAGSCVVVKGAFTGALKIEGTPGSPVHVLGGSIKSRQIDAKWTFFDGTELSASGGPGHVAIERSTLSLSRQQKTSGPAFLAPKTAATAAERTSIAITGSILGPYFDHAVRAQGAVDLTIVDTSFRDTWGAAVRATTESDGDALTVAIDDSEFVRTRAALHAESVTSDLPVALTGVAFLGGEPTTTFSWFPKAPVAAVLVRGGSGAIHDSSVLASAKDGILLDNVGPFTVAESEIADNAGHGLVVLGQVPAGLGPCQPVPQPGSQPGPVVWFWDPDPIVLGCRIAGNGGAGVEVEYPSIPMQVHGNHIEGNALEGFAIRKGRGLSAAAADAACPTGWRNAGQVDVPLSPETFVTGNDLVENGASAESHQLSSDHRQGTVLASENYWGTTDAGAVEAAVACVATCDITPFASEPIP